jgi:hypothetical protein
MKYLCLVYFNEKEMSAMSEQEWAALNRECIACRDGMCDSGHYIDGAPLESVETATTLRMRNGKLSITDGPFAETKEQLAGFYMIEARDLNEAIQVASKIPPARYGSVKVRPVRDLDLFREQASA